MLRLVLVFLFGIFVSQAFAWDATGHRVIAEIAYNNLNSKARMSVDQLTKVMDAKYQPRERFYYLSCWPDMLAYKDDVLAVKGWHFIDQPYVKDGVTPLPIDKENVVWAITESEHVLQSEKPHQYERALFLSFLLHFVGDIHQPLHCITLYNKEFPKGDSGGAFYPIETKYTNSLHVYWDQGVGLFRSYGKRYPLSYKNVKRLAKKIVADYPKNALINESDDLNAKDWAHESYDLAKKFAYNIKPSASPSVKYNKEGQRIVERQIALAGYRLANSLNKIFGDKNVN